MITFRYYYCNRVFWLRVCTRIVSFLRVSPRSACGPYVLFSFFHGLHSKLFCFAFSSLFHRLFSDAHWPHQFLRETLRGVSVLCLMRPKPQYVQQIFPDQVEPDLSLLGVQRNGLYLIRSDFLNAQLLTFGAFLPLLYNQISRHLGGYTLSQGSLNHASLPNGLPIQTLRFRFQQFLKSQLHSRHRESLDSYAGEQIPVLPFRFEYSLCRLYPLFYWLFYKFHRPCAAPCTAFA